MNEAHWRSWRVYRADYLDGYEAWKWLEGEQMYVWVGFDHAAAAEQVRQAARVHATTPGIDEIRYYLRVNLLHLDKTWEGGVFPLDRLDISDDEREWCAKFKIQNLYGSEDEEGLSDAMLIVTEHAASLELTPFRLSTPVLCNAHVLWNGHDLSTSELHYSCRPSSHDGSFLQRRR